MQERKDRLSRHMLIVCGPSGVGKSTLLTHLLNKRKSCRFSRSTTTRQPRGREKNGLEYDFVDVASFEKMISQNAFAEYANVFGNYYGTPHSMIMELIDDQSDLLFDIDVQGARQIKQKYPDAWCVLIAPPNLEALASRLMARKTDAPEVIERRLAQAKIELGQKDLFDFVIINDDLDIARENFLKVYDSLRLRSDR